MTRFRPRPRSNGLRIDVKAPDGYLLGGWRRVTKGGYLRFARGKWTHPTMKGRAGDYAWVHLDCCWGTEASFTFNEDKMWHGPWNGEQFQGGRIPMEMMDE